MMAQLGRLKKVALENIWPSEERDFTPWLAKKENLDVLSKAIGLDLELVETEKKISGSLFRADMLCKDTLKDNYVLIENQFKKTDHDHLGKLFTYGAGLDAVTIVWIAEHFRDEHIAAVDWLNEITGTKFNFFALEIELWSIEGSIAAPKFNIVSQPNDWSKSIKELSRQIENQPASPLQEKQYKFWCKLKEMIEQSDSELRPRTPRPQHWYDFAIGKSNFNLSATVNSQEKKMAVELYISGEDAHLFFNELKTQQEEISKEMDGAELDWRELIDRKASRIVLFAGSDFQDENKWEYDLIWIKEKLELFDRVFRERVKNLNLDRDNILNMEAAE